jgi:hypothetical protein
MGAAMIIRSYADVRRLTAYLQTVADWAEGFERRASDAQRRLETVGLNAEEYDQLIKEGRALGVLMLRLLRSFERRAA